MNNLHNDGLAVTTQYFLDVTDYAAYGEEPDYDGKHILQSCRVLSNYTVNLDLVQELKTDIEIEDGADTNRAKESDKQSLALLLDLPYIPMQSEDYWHTTEQKYKDTEENEPPRRNYIVVTKAGPRTDSPKPEKDRQIEQHINCRLQGIVQSFQTKPVTAKELIRFAFV